jgi:PAS domain S-box-containing protein
MLGFRNLDGERSQVKMPEPQAATDIATFVEFAEAVDQIVWSSDPHGLRDYYNPRWYEFTGMPPAGTAEPSWCAALHPEDRVRVLDAWHRALNAGETHQIEYRLRHHTGAFRWITEGARPVRGGSGRIRRWYGTCTDIHDLKEAEDQHRFLFELGEALRPLQAARKIQGAASAILRSWLSASRVRYVEAAGDGEFLLAAHSADETAGPGPDRYSIREYGEHLAEELTSGRMCWRDSTSSDASIDPANKAAAAAIGVGAWAAAPLVKDRTLVAMLVVHHNDAHLWTPRELALIEETAERTWAAAERARAEAALRDSEGRFRTLADGIPQLAWMTDSDGWIFWYNRRWFDYTGTTLEEMQGWGWTKVHHPDHVDRVVDRIRQCFEGGEPWEDTFPLRSEDGDFRWFLSRALPIRDDAGRIVRWFGTNTDITESLEKEAALREASERVELSLDSGAILGTWIWMVPEDRFTADERFARSWGLDSVRCREGIPAAEVMARILPEDRPRIREKMKAVMATGGALSIECRIVRDGGASRWVEANGRCECDAEGRAVRFPGVLLDIDARKQVEAQLRASEREAREATRLLEAVLEAVPAPIYVKDAQGRMQMANTPVMEAIGKPWEEVRGRTDLEYLDDPSQALQVMENDRLVISTGTRQELEEVVGMDETGRPRTWLSWKSPFRDEAGRVTGLVGASLDVTARKRAEDVRRLLVRELDHRVKNLLSIIAGMVTMSARGATCPREMATSLSGRIMALSRAHALIRGSVTGDAPDAQMTLHRLSDDVLAPYRQAHKGRLHIEGPDVALGPSAATSFALILHEFATNAAKHGALSAPEGRLQVGWHVAGDALTLDWTEAEGPVLTGPPGKAGFGSRLSRLSVEGQLGGNLTEEWDPSGLKIQVRVALTALVT